MDDVSNIRIMVRIFHAVFQNRFEGWKINFLLGVFLENEILTALNISLGARIQRVRIGEHFNSSVADIFPENVRYLV